MLHPFDNYIFTIDKNKDIAGTEMDGIRPALDGRIERMAGSGYDFLAVDKDMNKLVAKDIPVCRA